MQENLGRKVGNDALGDSDKKVTKKILSVFLVQQITSHLSDGRGNNSRASR